MHFWQRDSVRAFLPAVLLGFCGCGGGDDSGAVSQVATGPAPAAAENSAPHFADVAALDAQVGVPYEYLPQVRDADGDELAFSAENLPAWAEFDPSTGRISGMPRASDLGTYEDIVVTVADASHQVVSDPFSITVAGAGSNGVARLQWQKPMVRVDGAVLEDLAGYRIVYGRNEDDLDQSIFINDPDQLSYEFVTLSEGVWFFAVIAVSSNGLEGPPTPVAIKTV